MPSEELKKVPILSKEELMALAEKDNSILEYQGKSLSDYITTKQRDADHAFYSQELKRLVVEARKENILLLQKAIDIIQWMSGSMDFSPGGKAHEGWLKIQLDLDLIRNKFKEAGEK